MSAGEEVLVADGLGVLIRPIEPTDKRRLAEAFDRMSPETRYRRFFAPLKRLSEHDLYYLTEVDHHDHEALVAVDPEDGSIIGVTRYVRSAEPAEAEVAVAVTDPWQQRGLGTALLERLVERARAEGIDHFVALVLSENDRALETFRHLAPGGWSIRPAGSDNVEMVIQLPAPGQRVPETRLGRFLSAVAREALRVNPWPVMREAIGRRRGEGRDNRPFQ